MGTELTGPFQTTSLSPKINTDDFIYEKLSFAPWFWGFSEEGETLACTEHLVYAMNFGRHFLSLTIVRWEWIAPFHR